MDLFKHRSEINRRSARDDPGGPKIRLSTGRGVVRRLRWTGFAGAVLAIMLAMPPMSAVASRVTTQFGSLGLEISYVGSGEFNDLSIAKSAGYFYFRESEGTLGQTISPTQPCVSLPVGSSTDTYLARCRAVEDPVVRVLVSLGGGNDHLAVTDSARPAPFQPPPLGESFLLRALGGAGNDNLTGGAGDDELQGEGGSDVLSGGEGRDTADFNERTEPLTIDIDGEADDGEAGEGDNVRPDVECVIGGSGADTLIGSSAADCLYGQDGEDIIEGRGGDDVLEGGKDEAGDTLRGENGRDTLKGERGEDSLTGGDDEDTLMGGGGADELDGERGGDTVEGGPGGDALGGGEGDDSLYGGAVGVVVGADGDDRLDGGQGFDRLFGGKGNDLLDGGSGGDTMNGGDGRDTVTYDGRTTPVSVSLNGMADDGEEGENDNVADDVEAIIGTEVDDTLLGDHNSNSLDGGRGEDRIEADDGRDRPDDGRDRLTAGTESDLVNAHDGNVDVVDCGDDEDLAIADRDDTLRNCETFDRPGARQPEVGRYARVLREGQFRLRLPQGDRFFSLTQNVKIPIGSTIDPRDNDVRLVTARNDRGARQVASVSEGRFAVLQRGRRGAVTKLRLAGRLPDCRGSSTQKGRAKRAARSSPRRLRVAVARRNGNRGPRVLGKWSRGAAPGTEWLTEDRCDGTLTTVKSGTVRVRDFGRGRTVMVRPGKPYLARAE